MEGEQVSFNFGVTAYDKGLVKDNISVSEYQMRLICECLNISKECLNDCIPSDEWTKQVLIKKVKDIDKLIELIQTGAHYNFYEQISKCNKKRKKDDSDDVGEDAMLLSAKRKKAEQNKKG